MYAFVKVTAKCICSCDNAKNECHREQGTSCMRACSSPAFLHGALHIKLLVLWLFAVHHLHKYNSSMFCHSKHNRTIYAISFCVPSHLVYFIVGGFLPLFDCLICGIRKCHLLSNQTMIFTPFYKIRTAAVRSTVFDVQNKWNKKQICFKQLSNCT